MKLALTLACWAAFSITGCATTSDEPSQEPATNEVQQMAPESESLSSDSLGANCDSNYGDACVPIVTYDLDCPDVDGQVSVLGVDIHRFDRDGDGFGCEPW